MARIFATVIVVVLAVLGGWSLSADGAVGSRLVDVATGQFHTCVLDDGGVVSCWGDNRHGQLGDGSRTDRAVPVKVRDLPPVVAITTAEDRSCALATTGEVYCWGSLISDGDDPVTPEPIDGMTDIVAISGTCGLTSGGRVACTGQSLTGNSDPTTAMTIDGLTDVVAISASGHLCAATMGGDVVCLGDNGDGQLGDGTTSSRTTPAIVAGLDDATDVAVGRQHSCALLAGGAAHCWGKNGSGRLGDGTSETRFSPTPVVGLTMVDQLDGGVENTCAVTTDGVPLCWGDNTQAQLGDDSFGDRFDPPVPVVVGAGGSMGGVVLDTSDGSVVPGVVVDFFTADEAGARTGFVQSLVSDAGGQYRFDLSPAGGCYAVVAIAPDGFLFTNGTRWSETSRCFAAGESDLEVNALLDGKPSEETFRTGLFIANPNREPVEGVTVDLFRVLADGSRGQYLRSTSSGADGVAQFFVTSGCYTIIGIAPVGSGFVGTPSLRWSEHSVCIDGAGRLENATLAPTDL